MAYPPTLPPGTRTDDTPSAVNHAADHDMIVAALESIIAVLGSDPSGPFGDLSTRLAEDLAALENPDPNAAQTFGNVTVTGALTVGGNTTLGDADTDLVLRRGLMVETDARSSTPTYVSGVLTKIVEKVGATTVRTIDYTYTGGSLTKAVETVGTIVITTNYTYDGAGNYTGYTKAVTLS